MDSVVENDDELFRNSIKFLHSVSNLPSLNVPALKSFYSTKGRLMELRKSMYLPSNMTRMSIKCQRCFLNLLDGPASFRIKSEEKKSKFAKKLLKKSGVDMPMTKYQRKYLKRFNNFNGNHLAITCKFCKKESLIKLLKPEQNIQPKVSAVLSQKKKKFKKKDKFCGLNQEAVLSLTPQNIRNFNDSDVICIDAVENNPSRFKLGKKENLNKNDVKGKVTKPKNKLKKKKKALGKLGEFLNNSNKPKVNSSNLKHFLKGLES